MDYRGMTSPNFSRGHPESRDGGMRDLAQTRLIFSGT